MGGQGKTQSALNYCRQAFQDGTFDTILWIDATSAARTQHAIESIVFHFEWRSQDARSQTVSVQRYFSISFETLSVSI